MILVVDGLENFTSFNLNVINEENDKEKEEDNDKENNIVNNDNIEIVLSSIDRKTYLQMNRLISTFLKVKEKNQENLELKKNSKI